MLLDKPDFEKIHAWRQEQAGSLSSACFKLSSLILTPLLAVVLDGSANVATRTLWAYALGAFLAAMAGIGWQWQMRRLRREYASRVEVSPGKGNPSGIVTW